MCVYVCVHAHKFACQYVSICDVPRWLEEAQIRLACCEEVDAEVSSVCVCVCVCVYARLRLCVVLVYVFVGLWSQSARHTGPALSQSSVHTCVCVCVSPGIAP